jgi:MoxR-like ATPase
MMLAAKARAILHGRYHATTEDVRAMALPVMRHRVITTFNAEAAGITADEVVNRLLAEVRPPVEEKIT